MLSFQTANQACVDGTATSTIPGGGTASTGPFKGLEEMPAEGIGFEFSADGAGEASLEEAYWAGECGCGVEAYACLGLACGGYGVGHSLEGGVDFVLLLAQEEATSVAIGGVLGTD